MLNKSKLNLSVILLVVGLGLIPSGVLIKGFMYDQVYSEVSPVLVDIEDKIVEEIEDNYLGLGFYRAIPDIYDEKIYEIEQNYAKVYGIPSTLQYVQNITLEALPGFINASRSAIIFYNTYIDVVNYNSTEAARYNLTAADFAFEALFNNYTFQDDFFSTIEGVSERMTGGTKSLNYTISTATYLSGGRTINSTNYPGVRQDQTYGTTLLNWLEFYDNAEKDIGNNRSLIEQVYNCTWSSGQLQNLSAYITTYLWDIVKNDYDPMDIESYAEILFYDQWANASWLLSGFDLQFFSEHITSSLLGLEVGRDNPKNITYFSAINLWDPTNTSSFLHNEGIFKWFDAYTGDWKVQEELLTKFKLINTSIYTPRNASINFLYSWLFDDVRDGLVPPIYSLPNPIGIGISVSEYADIIYLEQWANGTHIPDGLDIYDGIKGFEVGIPIKSNITRDVATDLLYMSNSSSFTDRDGILKWIDAYQGNLTAQTEIINTFRLDSTQYAMINNWLFNSFRFDILPNITWGVSRTTMTQYAQFEFYRQWANGTLYENGYDPGPMFGLNSISGWEIGIPIKSNIPEGTSDRLWANDNSRTFVNYKGAALWYKAVYKGSEYYILRNRFDLTDDQMDTILEWLIDIRESFVVPMIQIRENLQTDIYTLADTMLFGFAVAGAVISGIGVLGVVLQLISKRK